VTALVPGGTTPPRRPDGAVSQLNRTVSAAELVDRALSIANLPSVVRVEERTEANLRWANNALTTNGEMRSRRLAVTATAPVDGGTAVGTVTRQIQDLDGVAPIVAAAEAIASSGPPAEDAMPLVDGEPAAGWDAEPAGTSIEVLSDVADALGAAFGKARNLGQLLFGFAEHVVTTTYLGSSTGLRRRGVQPTGRLEFNAKSSDLTASAWAGAATRDFTDLDVAAMHGDLTTRLGWAVNRIDLPPGRYETLLPPCAVADLLIYLHWTAGARDAEEGRNAFSAGDGRTKIGERLSELPIRLRSDPYHAGLECLDFVADTSTMQGTSLAFDGGAPIAPIDWISDGVLRDLVRNRGEAARTGQVATPPADNLIMDGAGTASLADMIASTERGLLLTTLWYIREVDPERLLLTGLTRDGVYLIENGTISGAVNNFRFNESPIELLGRLTEVGASEPTLCREWNDYVNRTAMPTIRVPDFNMSTVSQAS
jgi:predicted Zn-dependent protease